MKCRGCSEIQKQSAGVTCSGVVIPGAVESRQCLPVHQLVEQPALVQVLEPAFPGTAAALELDVPVHPGVVSVTTVLAPLAFTS